MPEADGAPPARLGAFPCRNDSRRIAGLSGIRSSRLCGGRSAWGTSSAWLSSRRASPRLGWPQVSPPTRSTGRPSIPGAGPSESHGNRAITSPGSCSRMRGGGAEGNRTPDLCSAIAALSHLSYGPARARYRPGATPISGSLPPAQQPPREHFAASVGRPCRPAPPPAAGTTFIHVSFSHAEVVGSDGQHAGRVDGTRDRIILTKTDA